jgi:hypothetical protein
MKAGAVPFSFTTITGVFSARTNLALLEAVNRQKVDPSDGKTVKKIWEAMCEQAAASLETEQLAAQERERVRREEGQKSAAVMENIKSTFPALQWKKLK